MSGKHTPGPWVVKPADADYRAPDKDDFAIITPDMMCVGTCWGDPLWKDGKANARLISAAPELLEALRELHDDVCARFDIAGPSMNPGMLRAVETARAAIARATGEQS